MQRISKKIQRYAGKDVAAGEPFDVHPNHIRILVVLGNIEPAEGDYGYVAKPITAQHHVETVPVTKTVESEVEPAVEPAVEPQQESPPTVAAPVVAPAPAVLETSKSVETTDKKPRKQGKSAKKVG